METVIQLLMTNRIPRISSSAVLHSHTHTHHALRCTSTVRKAAHHIGIALREMLIELMAGVVQLDTDAQRRGSVTVAALCWSAVPKESEQECYFSVILEGVPGFLLCPLLFVSIRNLSVWHEHSNREHACFSFFFSFLWRIVVKACKQLFGAKMVVVVVSQCFQSTLFPLFCSIAPPWFVNLFCDIV